MLIKERGAQPETATYNAAYRKIEQYVRKLFREHQTPALYYHNLNHTLSVVARAGEIASHYALKPEEHFCLMAAAWLHDAGHLFTEPLQHELESVRIMRSYFASVSFNEPLLVSNIASCIMSTRMPTQPHSLVEMILCDADSYHLGTPEFRHIDALVKLEAEARGWPLDHWHQDTLQLLRQHRYYTDYCRRTLNDGKWTNIVAYVAEARTI